MASVKLFHVTEFAESLFQSPLAHRTALHPLVMLLLVALWLATAGHWPLWQTLLMHTEAGAVRPAMALAVFAHLFLGALIWLALTCWRWTFKPAITLLLVWAALGSCAMWLLRAAGEAMSVSPVGLMQFLLKSENWSRLLSLPCLLTLVAVFLIPALLIWRTPIRRIPLMVSVASNGLLLVASFGLFTFATRLVGHALPSPIDPSEAPGIAGLLQWIAKLTT